MPKLKDQYELLKENSPSVVGNSLLMFIYRIVGMLLSLAAILFSISLLVNAAIGNQLMSFITGTPAKLPDEVTAHITVFVALVSIGLGILFFIISTLAKRLLKRNTYIIELEEIIEDGFEGVAAQAVEHKTR